MFESVNVFTIHVSKWSVYKDGVVEGKVAKVNGCKFDWMTECLSIEALAQMGLK